MNRVYDKSIILKKFYKFWIVYLSPNNFNYWWNFGSIALVILILQILTGIFLAIYYKNDIAFYYEENIIIIFFYNYVYIYNNFLLYCLFIILFFFIFYYFVKEDVFLLEKNEKKYYVEKKLKWLNKVKHKDLLKTIKKYKYFILKGEKNNIDEKELVGYRLILEILKKWVKRK